MVKTMAKLCMAHGSTHGARKPPGPKEEEEEEERLNDGDNNGQAMHGARKLTGPTLKYIHSCTSPNVLNISVLHVQKAKVSQMFSPNPLSFGFVYQDTPKVRDVYSMSRPPQFAVSGRLSARHICENPDLAGTF